MKWRSAQALALIATIFLCVLLADAGGSAQPAQKLRVGLVLEVGIDDPFDGIAYRGLRRAVRDLGIEGRVVVPGFREGPFPSFASFARQGYDLVVGIGVFEVSAMDRAARRFPDTRFFNVDAAWETFPHRPKNVRGTVYRVEQAAYLAGYLAALMEARRPGKDIVSSVGGIKIPSVDRFIAGYRAGARRANRRITALNGYANDFLDQERCKRLALSQIARGSGVVFNVAGACGLGALTAAKQEGVWGIGVDADQSFLGPHILTSVVKRLDVAVYESIRLLKEGRFRTAENAVFDLGNGGVGLGKVGPKVPRSLVAEVERIHRQIVSGKIEKIPTTVR